MTSESRPAEARVPSRARGPASPSAADVPSPSAEFGIAVDMRDISKRFGAVQALDGASFTARSGEVHALLGENGAGKTTLMNVLSGLYLADSGSISIRGESARIASPQDAVLRGVGMVHQHPELIGAFTGHENIALARPGSRATSRYDRGREEIEALVEQYGLPVDLRKNVRELAMGERQKVEIIRELYRGATILILDEPTTHLTPGEFDGLFSAIRRLAASGMSAILISHKLHEIFAVADQITVLRKGTTVGSHPRTVVTQDALVAMMLGTSVPDAEAVKAAGALDPVHEDDREQPDDSVREASATAPTGPPLLDMSGVRVKSGGRSLEVDGLNVRRGEIVGVAGVAGNGQRELVDVLVGTLPARAGRITLAGRDIVRASVAQRIRAGIAVLPDDRLNEGALPASPLWQTYTLGLHQTSRSRWDIAGLKTQTQKMIDRFSIAARGPDAITADLSGGTLQRALVARSLQILSKSSGGLLVAVNPTQGLDIGATRFVREHLRELTRNNGAVLLISEDLDELFELSDRIAVLFSNVVTAEYPRERFDRYAIGANMVGAQRD